MITGGGRDLLETVGALVGGLRRDAVIESIALTVAWLEDGARDRRSVSGLAGGDTAVRKRLSSVADADPHAIDVALMRAQREMSDEPLTMRIGVNEVPKQARSTDDVWDANEIGRQRGAPKSRSRSGRLMIVSSKHAGSPTLPGATSAIRRGDRPDAAVARVARSIRDADPDARIVNIELDGFDDSVSTLRRETATPFTFRAMPLLDRAGFGGPVALILGTEPRISGTAVSGGARDVAGLRVGRRGQWSEPHAAEVEVPSGDGSAIEREPVRVRISDEVSFGAGSRSVRARVARVVPDPCDGVRLPTEPKLVAMRGLRDEEALVELAATALSATDEHPEVMAFLEAREAARVFRGEQETRQALHVDRAIASIAVAVHLLDKQAVGA